MIWWPDGYCAKVINQWNNSRFILIAPVQRRSFIVRFGCQPALAGFFFLGVSILVQQDQVCYWWKKSYTSHQLVNCLSQYLHSFIHPRCTTGRISSINSNWWVWWSPWFPIFHHFLIGPRAHGKSSHSEDGGDQIERWRPICFFGEFSTPPMWKRLQ